MTSGDKPRLIRALAEACAVLRVPLTQEVADTYCRMLADLPIAGVLASLEGLIKVTDRLPSISAIRAGCEQSTGHAPGSQTPGQIGRASCAECEGRGWVSTTVQHAGQSTRLARRCGCRRG